MSYAAENSSVFRCALIVVMVAELFVTGDREFHTSGAVILNALDWKLMVVAVLLKECSVLAVVTERCFV